MKHEVGYLLSQLAESKSELATLRANPGMATGSGQSSDVTTTLPWWRVHLCQFGSLRPSHCQWIQVEHAQMERTPASLVPIRSCA